MKVLLKTYSNKIFQKNKIFSLNSGDNIFAGFKSKLKKYKIELNTLDMGNPKEVDSVVYCDIPLIWEINSWKKLIGNKNKSILFCFESPLVNPFSHYKIFHVFFKSVYTWNDKLVDRTKVKKFCLPVLDTNLNMKQKTFERKKFMCLINSNKSTLFLFWLISPFKKNLYEERIRAINFFESKLPNGFDLYGIGWNAPAKFSLKEKIFGYKIHKSYRGTIPRNLNSKIDILSRYKFKLCFENCVADGYISEKIIDCFKAGTVPIYYGAPNIENFIPKKCFIDLRNFKNYEDLLVYLQNMNKKTYEDYIENVKKFLKSKQFKNIWLESAFQQTFLEAIS